MPGIFHLVITTLTVLTTSGSSQSDATERLLRGIDAIVATHEAVPGEVFALADLVDAAGPSPQDLAVWVRQNTRLVPYLGTLRGAEGVLEDRTGNSLDRALLLARLLEIAHHDVGDVRLAHATLKVDEAARLLNSSREPAATGLPSGKPGLTGILYDNLAEAGFDTARIAATVDGAVATQRARRRAMQQAADETTALLLDAVGIDARGDPAHDLDQAITALRDHWWVQIAADGGFADLDPSFLDKPRTAQETRSVSDIPARLVHEVVVRVIVESWSPTGTYESMVLEHPLRPDQLFDTSIRLSHEPLSWPRRAAIDSILAQRAWQPVLWIGERRVTQRHFSVEGVSAEWLEFEIRAPGVARRVERREVFDLLGPGPRSDGSGRLSVTTQAAKRRAMCLLGSTEILVTGSRTSPAAHMLRILDGLRANRSSLATLIQGSGESRTAQESIERLCSLVSLPGPVHRLALGRDTWSTSSNAFFLNQPNIIASHLRLTSEHGGSAERSIDVVVHDLAVHSGGARPAFELRLRRGVLETLAEELAHGCCGRHENMVTLQCAAAEQGVDWQVLRPGDAAATRTCLALHADLRARLESDLRTGYIVVAPEGDVMIDGEPVPGWWRIDPTTGTTLGMGARGWGQDTLRLDNYFAILPCCEGLEATARFPWLNGLGRQDGPGQTAEDHDILLLDAALCTLVTATHGTRIGGAQSLAQAVDNFIHALASHVAVEAAVFGLDQEIAEAGAK